MVKPDGATPELDLPAHGASILPSVTVDSYNVEIEDTEGFVGDRANKKAFWELVDKWRKLLQKDHDPLGTKASEKIGKQKLAELLADGEPQAAAVVMSALDDFAQELATIIRRYLRLKDWRKTECIVIGGGFSAGRLGRLAVARAELLLRAEGISLDLDIIRNDPNEAGLLGAAHLLPAWMLKGHNGLLAIDIGGTNFHAGIVKLGNRSAGLATMRVVKAERWRHGDEDVDRDAATRKLIKMLKQLLRWARRHGVELAPLVGVACPGLIEEDGSIERGGQNLPGNWESSRFNVPTVIRAGIPKIGKNETLVVMHNDAVVQGLSELPRMKNRKSWGVLTIGTGLGNARYTNRKPKWRQVMTMTKQGAAGLFEQQSDSSLVVVSVKGADAQIQDTGMVALRATILAPETLAPSSTELVVQMLPIDADKFATTVKDAAKSGAWKFPGDAKFVKWQEDRSKE